jgi:hypothetical protein
MQESTAVTIGDLSWETVSWGDKSINGRQYFNRPLNTQAVSLVLAQKLNVALFNAYTGLETKIYYAGVEEGIDKYWIVLPKMLALSKMDELRAFVKGFMMCYQALV